MAERNPDFDEEDAAIYVHTHPSGSAPSSADVANNTLPRRLPVVDLTIGDDIYLYTPTAETREARESLPDEQALYRQTRMAHEKGRSSTRKRPDETFADFINRVGENGFRRAAKESRHVVYRIDGTQDGFQFKRVKKSFAE